MCGFNVNSVRSTRTVKDQTAKMFLFLLINCKHWDCVRNSRFFYNKVMEKFFLCFSLRFTIYQMFTVNIFDTEMTLTTFHIKIKQLVTVRPLRSNAVMLHWRYCCHWRAGLILSFLRESVPYHSRLAPSMANLRVFGIAHTVDHVS